VLIAAGQWTRQLAREMVGFDLVPTAIVPHQYLIFDKIEGVTNELPVVRDYDQKYYLKPEVGSFALGIFEADPISHFPDQVQRRNRESLVERSASNELYEESYEKFSPHIEEIMGLVPILEESGMKAWIHGPDCHSIDHSPIMGQLGPTQNAYVATGFNSQGIQASLGAGLAMSEWLYDGHPRSFSSDFTACDVQRFARDMVADTALCETRAAEGYGTEYKAHFPGEQFESMRQFRKLPAHDRHCRAGAVFAEGFGWERYPVISFIICADPRHLVCHFRTAIIHNLRRPLYYKSNGENSNSSPTRSSTDVHHVWLTRSPESTVTPRGFSFDVKKTEWFDAEKREAIACRDDAVVFDLSSFGKLQVTGALALSVLQDICTNDVGKPEGSLVYTFALHEDGGIMADFTVVITEDGSFYIVTLSDQIHLVQDHIRRHVAKK
jgi:4-methylaminobutanoate oxidase (formaldehyde-forming)